MNAPGRPVSGLERAWLAADRIAPPFVNQLVLEAGRGAVLPEAAALRGALAALAAVCPSVAARLRGAWSGLRWAPGGAGPVVVEAEAGAWDGASSAGAPAALRAPLSPGDGPVCAVVRVSGEVPRLVLRTHHAAFDGGGAILVADLLFALLRGEAVDPVPFGPPTDAALAAGVPPTPDPAPVAPAPTGVSDGPGTDSVWMRRRAPLGPGPVLPRILAAVADAAGAPVRVGVPADLRRRHPGLRSTANLTGIAHLHLAPGAGPAAAAAALSAALAAQGPEAMVANTAGWVHLPVWLMVAAGRRAAATAHTTGRWATSATVSNLGRAPLDRWTAGAFRPEAAFWIPPGNPGLPLFLSATGGPLGVELCAAAPAPLATGGRLEALLARVAAALG